MYQNHRNMNKKILGFIVFSIALHALMIYVIAEQNAPQQNIEPIEFIESPAQDLVEKEPPMNPKLQQPQKAIQKKPQPRSYKPKPPVAKLPQRQKVPQKKQPPPPPPKTNILAKSPAVKVKSSSDIKKTVTQTENAHLANKSLPVESEPQQMNNVLDELPAVPLEQKAVTQTDKSIPSEVISNEVAQSAPDVPDESVTDASHLEDSSVVREEIQQAEEEAMKGVGGPVQYSQSDINSQDPNMMESRDSQLEAKQVTSRDRQNNRQNNIGSLQPSHQRPIQRTQRQNLPHKAVSSKGVPSQWKGQSTGQQPSQINILKPTSFKYPTVSRRLKEEGSAVLRILFDERGQPQRVDIIESTGSNNLDRAALQGIRTLRIKPLGHPFIYELPVRFQLDLSDHDLNQSVFLNANNF